MIIFFLFLESLLSFRCMHDPSPLAFSSSFSYPDRLQAVSPIRILLYFKNFRFQGTLNSSVRQANSLAVSYLQATFKVNHQMIFTKQTTCADIDLPKQLVQTYLDTDLVMFVSSSQIIDSFAAAKACILRDSIPNRPTFGRILWSIKQVSQRIANQKWGFQMLIRVGLHEMMHVLGFASNLYKFFVPTEVLKMNEDVYYIVTSSVQAQTQSYFGCKQGMPLETDSNSSGNHWEEEVLSDEIMTPIFNYGDYMFISKITLALFKDSGLYADVDFSLSQTQYMRFGKGKGCTFLAPKRVCSDFSEFCSENSSSAVTIYRVGRATCKTNLFTTCRINIQTGISICADSFYAGSQPLLNGKTLESKGGKSRAFKSSVAEIGSLFIIEGVRCFNTFCNGALLFVEVNGLNYQCFDGGKINDPSRFLGSVSCPDRVSETCASLMRCEECVSMCVREKCLGQSFAQIRNGVQRLLIALVLLILIY